MQHDKKIRRRRITLVVLCALCLALLTASFGGSATSGALESVQRGALEVLAPIQAGSSRALKPLRDLVGWVSDTVHAKGEVKDLRAQRDSLRRQVVGAASARRENAELRKLVNLDEHSDLKRFAPVTARVIGRSPNLWFTTVNINSGRTVGVRVSYAVVNGDGLVGRVTKVADGAAQVTLITDHTSAVSARIDATGVEGVLHRSGGNPSDLVLDFIPPNSKVEKGQRVVTAGSRSERLESLFPPGIPIGTISKVDPEELELYQRVHVRPYVDLRRLEFVQVLTKQTTGGA